MTENTWRLVLNPEPDGFGFLYGRLEVADGTSHTVNVMPPIAEWRGDMKMDGAYAPHPTDWVVYVDGEKIARVARRDDLASAIGRRLLAR